MDDEQTTRKQQMDALARQYTEELVGRYNAGEMSADELRAELEQIPAWVYSEVCIIGEQGRVG